MAAGTLPAVLGGANVQTLIVRDNNGNVAASISLVDANGLGWGVQSNPLSVAITNWGSGLATNQVIIGTSPTQIVPARVGRRGLIIIQESTTLVRLGPAGVLMSTGVPLPGNLYATFTFEGGAAIFGIAASGTAAISCAEVF